MHTVWEWREGIADTYVKGMLRHFTPSHILPSPANWRFARYHHCCRNEGEEEETGLRCMRSGLRQV